VYYLPKKKCYNKNYIYILRYWPTKATETTF